VFYRYTKVPDQPHHLLLVGGQPGEHQLRRGVQPPRHHAVEEGALHHLGGGVLQHAGPRHRRQVRAGGGFKSQTLKDDFRRLSSGYVRLPFFWGRYAPEADVAEKGNKRLFARLDMM